MKEILIFSHNYLINNWYDVVSEQLILLVKSELYENSTTIYYCGYGDDELQIHKFVSLLKKTDIKKKIYILIFPYNDREKSTISFLQRICKSHNNAYVLYYHTKGVYSACVENSKNAKTVNSWRDVLNYFNIENWKKSISALDSHDICGVLYANWHISGVNGDPDRFSHFYAGNFWWTTSNYINKLPDANLMNNYNDMETFITSIPHRWANGEVQCAGNIYNIYFDPKEYRKN
jgi:hypothetical protein